MDDELEELARRYRLALEARAGATTSDEDAAEAQVARDALLGDLAALGEAIGVAEAPAATGDVVWTHGVRTITFARKGAREIAVSWRDPVPRTGRLYREAVLGHRWVLATEGFRGDKDRVPLRHQGLETLLQGGLALPKPEDGPLPPPGDEPEVPPADEGAGAPPKRRL